MHEVAWALHHVRGLSFREQGSSTIGRWKPMYMRTKLWSLWTGSEVLVPARLSLLYDLGQDSLYNSADGLESSNIPFHFWSCVVPLMSDSGGEKGPLVGWLSLEKEVLGDVVLNLMITWD